eukprot:1442849-Amphidinium_carterae.1
MGNRQAIVLLLTTCALLCIELPFRRRMECVLNTQDPTNEPPWVRFANSKSADAVLYGHNLSLFE